MIHNLPQSLIETATQILCGNYLNENTEATQLSLGHLQKTFDDALEKHLSYPAGSPERMRNSREMRERVGKHTGLDEKTKQVRPLLTQNTKMLKAGMQENPITIDDYGTGVETTGLSLAPAYSHGKFKICPNSHSCKDSCLGKTSGGYFQYGGGSNLSVYKGPRLGNLKRTHALINDPEAFIVRLHDEIEVAKHQAQMNGNKLGVRLNVLSDIHPKVYKSLMEAHPTVMFYDYTKNNSDPVSPNHHLTYSSTGVSQPRSVTGLNEDIENKHQNWHQMRSRLEQGKNVAIAFSHKSVLPKTVHDEETGNTYNVIDGNTHDYRPIDGNDSNGKGFIVGLTNKSKNVSEKESAKESNGFFVHYDPKLKMENGKQVRDENGKPIPQVTEVRIAPQKRKTIVLNNDSEKETV